MDPNLIADAVAIIILVLISLWNKRDSIAHKARAATEKSRADTALTVTDEATVLIREEVRRLQGLGARLEEQLGQLEDGRILTEQNRRLQSDLTASKLMVAELQRTLAFVRSEPACAAAVDRYLDGEGDQATKITPKKRRET